MHSLPLFLRLTDQPVIVLGEGEAAEAKRRLVERAGARVVDEQDPAARLAFVALGDPAEAAARLKSRGLLVNVVDRPELCDFTVPSLLERGPVLVAVGTGGVSAGLAKALRLRLEAMLPDSLGALADKLGGARAMLRTRWPDPAARRRVLDQGLAPNGPLDPLQGDSAERFDTWLAGAGDAQPQQHTIVLRSPDPDDLTLREARWLGTADALVLDGDIPPEVLARARADAVRLAPGDQLPSGTVVLIRQG